MKISIFLSIFIITLSISSCFSVKSNINFTYQKLSPGLYADILKDSVDFYLIDVRTPSEYNRSHMKNALNFSFLKFHFGRDVDSLDRNKIVFVYCQTCHRSPLAARKMKHKGFRKVIDLKGGYQKWTSADH